RPLAATVPFSTLVKKSAAVVPPSRTVASHGPLILPPENVSTACPVLFSTSRQPACAVAAVPSVVGRLPTITQPACNATDAVVRPTPPGHEPGRLLPFICANVCTAPPGEISMIVVPVPCRLAELLKLLIRMSP